MRRLSIPSFIATLFMLSLTRMAVAQDFNAVSVTALPASNCSRASIELVAQVSGLEHETYRVTSSGKEFDYSSPRLISPQDAITGAVSRSINFPATAAENSLIGIAYTMGGADLTSNSNAHFFVVYSCTNATTVFSCVGHGQDCPSSIEDYLPHLKRAPYSPRGTFGSIADRSAHERYIGICNKGYVGTTIGSVAIEGRNTGSFSFTSNENFPLQLPAGSCSYVSVKFRSRSIGDFSAALRVRPINPEVEDFVLPLSASTLRRPDLAVDVRDIKLGKIAGKKAILGVAIVENRGLATSRIGAVITVKISGYYSTDKSLPVTLAETSLPALKPGEKKTVRFSSSKHDFSGPINKIISARIRGSERQRGLNSSITGFSDDAYFDYAPGN